MNKNLVAFFTLVIVGSIALLGYYFGKPVLERRAKKNASDARDIKDTITVGVDSWAGYYALCGMEMQKRMRGAGYRIKCEDDNADYPARIKALAEGRLAFAVATVDSYLINGSKDDFPGVIVAVIDESFGGDAIVARKDAVKNIEDLKARSDYKIAYTPASPSEHLLKAVASHFAVPQLGLGFAGWRVLANGSADALEKLKNRDVEVAVLWEPDVSRALASGDFVKILGTEATRKLIVDVLLVNRDFIAASPDIVKLTLANYFRALKIYRDNPAVLIDEVARKIKLPDDAVVAMLKGVKFMTLENNAMNWFGVAGPHGLGNDGLIDAIESTVQILTDYGDFTDSPLPNGDPYLLQNSTFVKELYETGVGASVVFSGSGDRTAEDSLERNFDALDETQWAALSEIGMLKIRPITFQSGTSDLDLNGKMELDKAAANLKHYPNFRVLVKGHSGVKGDPEANRVLSFERAEAVARYLMITYSIDTNRVRALGVGAEKPLARQPFESERAYNYRLPRVELSLVSEGY